MGSQQTLAILSSRPKSGTGTHNTPHKEVLSIRQVMESSPLPAVIAIAPSANRWPR